jgi:hypothetical protein
MVIRDIKLTQENGQAVLSAECRVRKIGWDRVFFSVPETQADYLYPDASPFVAALLIPAMRQGEDLVVHGSLSKQLYDNLPAIMQTAAGWGVGLKPVAVRADTLQPDSAPGSRTASFFSGGVDAFYTYLKHKNNPETGARIESFILVHGFDIDLDDTQLWERTKGNIEQIAQAEGIELVTVASNIYDVLEPLLMSYFQPWDYTHGGCLGAVGLALRSAFGRIYIPSTFSKDEDAPWGSNPVTDPLWGTESLVFSHDGVEANRLQKILHQVAHSSVALEHLRVCYVNPGAAYNCGQCPKCHRTMIGLYIAGVLERAKMFPSELNLERIAATADSLTAGEQIFFEEESNLAALRERNLNPALQQAIVTSMAQTVAKRGRSLQQWRHQAVRKALYVDYAYAGGYGFRALTRRYGKRFF